MPRPFRPKRLPRGDDIDDYLGKGGGKRKGGGGRAPKKPRQPKPEAQLLRQVSRLADTVKPGNILTGEARDTRGKIEKMLKGYSPDQVKAVAKEAGVDYGKVKGYVKGGEPGGFSPVGAARDLGGSALGWTLKQASRPGQGVVSAVAEWSRQGEKNPTQLGPLSLRFGVSDPGKIAEAAKEGVSLERHDTPGTIAKEAGEIRKRQGAGTKSFGVIPGTDLRRGLEVIPNAPKPPPPSLGRVSGASREGTGRRSPRSSPNRSCGASKAPAAASASGRRRCRVRSPVPGTS